MRLPHLSSPLDPSGFSRWPWGLPNPVPPLPREVLQPEACRGEGLPSPSLTMSYLQLEGEEEEDSFEL